MAAEPGRVIWMRPERAAAGRPPGRSRAEITAVAVALADREGADAVTMRRVAAELGTGAASLYRYLDNREDLLDLMSDFTGAEYVLTLPTGNWLADLIEIGEQARSIMRRHCWLPSLIATRPTLGPNGVALLQHVLVVLESHPAGLSAKLEAFAMLMTVTAAFAQAELAEGAQERNAAYLQHAVASGEYPRLNRLLQAGSATPGDPVGRYTEILGRVLSGLLNGSNVPSQADNSSKARMRPDT
jgi:AcrR family transcriptional regulator